MKETIIGRIIKIKDLKYSKGSIEYGIITTFIDQLLYDSKLRILRHVIDTPLKERLRKIEKDIEEWSEEIHRNHSNIENIAIGFSDRVKELEKRIGNEKEVGIEIRELQKVGNNNWEKVKEMEKLQGKMNNFLKILEDEYNMREEAKELI